MAEVAPNIRQLNFDLRAIADKTATTPGCIRSDLGYIKFDIDPALRPILQQQAEVESFAYAPTLGLPLLIERLQANEQTIIRLFDSPDTLITSGGQAALFASIKTWVTSGDFILTDEAYYPPYSRISRILNAQICSHDFTTLTPEELDARPIKMLLLNSPNNPTGKIYSERELRQLAEMARARDWIVIEDAVYSRIFYDTPPVSIAKYCPERTLVIQSASKNLALPGARIGWIHGEKKHVLEVAKVHRNMNSCPNTFFQNALANYLPETDHFIQKLVIELRQRQGLFRQILDDLQWEYTVPEGAIYLWAKLPRSLESGPFIDSMIERAGISAMPGHLFGQHPNRIRFCFGALTQGEIARFGQRLKAFAHA